MKDINNYSMKKSKPPPRRKARATLAIPIMAPVEPVAAIDADGLAAII